MSAMTLPRETVARIVSDLARGHRTRNAIAQRHRVHVDVVAGLAAEFGPDSGRLAASAKMLRQPEQTCPPPAEVAEPPAEPEPQEASADAPSEPAPQLELGPPPAVEPGDRIGTDGLTPAQRKHARQWAQEQGVTVGKAGALSADVVNGWLIHYGVAIPEAEPVTVAEPEPEASFTPDIPPAKLADDVEEVAAEDAPAPPVREVGDELTGREAAALTILAVDDDAGDEPTPGDEPLIDEKPTELPIQQDGDWHEYPLHPSAAIIRGRAVDALHQVEDLLPFASQHCRDDVEHLVRELTAWWSRMETARIEVEGVRAAARALEALDVAGQIPVPCTPAHGWEATARAVLQAVGYLPADTEEVESA